MEQNIWIDTKDGKVKIQFEKCETCEHFVFCYLENGSYHKGTPKGLSDECFNN